MTRRQKIFTFIFIALGAAAVIFFGLRAARTAMRMRGNGNFGKPPAAKQTDISLIRDWMTVPYVAHMYEVPPDALFKSLELDDFDDRKKSLKELNEEYYPNEDGIMLLHVQAAIQSMQKQEKPPHFPATPIPFTPPAAPTSPKP